MEQVEFAGLVVLKFYSDTCAPCKRIVTIIKKMQEEFQSVKIYNVDIEEDYQLAKRFSVKSVPTLVFLNGEKEQSRIDGLANTETIRKSFKALVG